MSEIVENFIFNYFYWYLVNAPVKEEQLSEAWSLDADPPESVINEPINDQLADDQISSLSAFLSNSRPTQSSSINHTSSNQVPLYSNNDLNFNVSVYLYLISYCYKILLFN